MFEKNEYDRNVNTFSNQGRLYQVEYAMKAVEQGCTTLGIQTKDGVILAAEKKISSKLQIPSSIENIMKIDSNVICTYSGLRSDARALIETARVEAANHWFTFNEHMPVEAISLAICDVTLSFAEKKKKKEKKKKELLVVLMVLLCLLLVLIEMVVLNYLKMILVVIMLDIKLVVLDKEEKMVLLLYKVIIMKIWNLMMLFY